jgi:hypothetical protein
MLTRRFVLIVIVPTSLANWGGNQQTRSYAGQAVLVLDSDLFPRGCAAILV